MRKPNLSWGKGHNSIKLMTTLSLHRKISPGRTGMPAALSFRYNNASYSCFTNISAHLGITITRCQLAIGSYQLAQSPDASWQLAVGITITRCQLPSASQRVRLRTRGLDTQPWHSTAISQPYHNTRNSSITTQSRHHHDKPHMTNHRLLLALWTKPRHNFA